MKRDEVTFNDMPQMLTDVYHKLEGMEQQIGSIYARIQSIEVKEPSSHIPMTVPEACEYFQINKTNLYYYIRKCGLPAIRFGKHYTLYKDEVIQWMELYRKNPVPPSAEELAEAMVPKSGRKTDSSFG